MNMDDEWQSAGSENAANAELVSSAPVDASVDSEESRIIFQTKRVNLAIAVLPNAFDDARFHIGGMDDPRIITPLGSEIVLNVYNQDGLRSHGWKLIRRTPPFPSPEKAASDPPAFQGAEISHIPPNEQGTAHFIVDQPGVYTYICPELNDHDIGLYGIWEVVPGH